MGAACAAVCYLCLVQDARHAKRAVRSNLVQQEEANGVATCALTHPISSSEAVEGKAVEGIRQLLQFHRQLVQIDRHALCHAGPAVVADGFAA